MAQFGRHLDCRANNCNFVAKTQQESEKNTTLTKVIDRLSEKLEQLQVEVDDGDKNPLSS